MEHVLIRKAGIISGLLLLVLATSLTAHAQDDIFCAQYAKTAVAQQETNATNGCGLTGPRWSAAYAGHFEWCMHGNNARLAPGEQKAREEALRQCTGAPPLVPECDAYARSAVSQNNHNTTRVCGFTGPRWSSDYDAHYAWCTYGNNAQQAAAETHARQQALDTQCATAQGDLVAYDWCYALQSTPPSSITFHPVIFNDGERDWHSTREGTYSIGATIGATAKQANHSLLASPYWSIEAGEAKILEGVTLPFAETNTYYNPGSWLFTHPDDTNPRNNELANRSHDALLGRDFMRGGRFSSLQCPSSQVQPCTSGSSMMVTLRLRQIEVIDEGDGDGNAEPYLFPFFFKIETPKPPTTTNRGWYHAPGGAHGNLGNNYGKDWDAGNVIHVPIEIGRWQTTLRLDPKLSETSTYLGVVVLLLEEDHFPLSKDVPAHYARFADTMVAKLTDALAWGVLVGRPLPRCASCTMTLESEIEKSMKEKLSGYPVDLDDVIGTAVFTWSMHDLKTDPYQVESRVWNGSTGSEDGAFTIQADIMGRPACK